MGCFEAKLIKLAREYKVRAQVTPAKQEGISPLVHPMVAIGKIAGNCDGGWPMVYFAGGEAGGIGDPTHFIGIGKRDAIARFSIDTIFAHFGFNAGLPRAVEVLNAFKREYESRIPNGQFPFKVTPDNVMPIGYLGHSGSLSFSMTGELSVVVESAYEAIRATTVPVYSAWASCLRELHISPTEEKMFPR